MKVRIGVIHDKLKFDAKRSNAKKLNEQVRRLVDEYSVDVVVLPPYSFYGPLSVYDESRVKRIAWSNAERITVGPTKAKQGNITSLLIKWSFEYGVYLIGGPIIERAGPRIYLTAVVTSPRGTVIGKHRKVLLNGVEESIGISPGRFSGVVKLDRFDLTIALFMDEDILMSDLFKLARLSATNIVIGLMMPQTASAIPVERGKNGVLSYKKDIIFSLAIARSVETGIPIMIAGGAIETEEGYEMMASYTIPVEPDVGVIEDKVKYLDELGVPLVLEVDSVASRPKLIGIADFLLAKEVCKCMDKLAESLMEETSSEREDKEERKRYGALLG
ncbi:MAG: carbon-nitrogen hydrolase family protein [Acidilobaceae archaeon]